MSSPRLDPDVALMLAFQEGDDSAFAKLFIRNKDRIFHFTSRYFNDQDLAEEFTQETFLRVYQARAIYKPLAAFSTWAFGIAAQLCLNAIRDRRRQVPLEGTPSEDGVVVEFADLKSPSHDETVTQKEMSEAVSRALQRLPQTQRILVILTYFDDLPIVEAARIIGVSAVGARLRLLRARRQLKEILQNFE